MSTLSNKSPELQPAAESNDWQHHEHIADSAKAHAQQLVDELGSVDLAKHAIETVGEVPKTDSSQPERQTQLCQALNFENIEDLRAHSSPVESNDGKHWFTTELADHSWTVWRDEEFRTDRHFATRAEALASVPHDEGCSGSSLLG
jgi:hypothetical protein